VIYRRISFTVEYQTNDNTKRIPMLTEMGIKRLKKLVMKLARPGDDEWNAIVQATVVSINRLIQSRFK